MNEQVPKYLSEFSLTNEGKEKLQIFFDTHFDELRGPKRIKTGKQLEQILSEVLSPELFAVMKQIFAGKAECAMLIHNLPEAQGIENMLLKKITSNNTYSYHIGNALYRMNDISKTWGTTLVRRAPNIPFRATSFAGMNAMHRDMVPKLSGSPLVHGEYIMFSCPYNAEHACISITHAREAIRSIPADIRDKVIVEIMPKGGGYFTPITISDLLTRLDIPLREESTIQDIALPETQTVESCILLEALNRHSIRVDLQPGDLLLINEQTMFHRANEGSHLGAMEGNPFYSRVLVNNAGRPKR